MNTITLSLTDDQLAAMQTMATNRSTNGQTLAPTDLLMAYVANVTASVASQNQASMAAQIAALPPSAMAQVQSIITANTTPPPVQTSPPTVQNPT